MTAKREEALRAGRKTYVSEHVCKAGHVPTIRRTSNKICTQCDSETKRVLYKDNKERAQKARESLALMGHVVKAKDPWHIPESFRLV